MQIRRATANDTETLARFNEAIALETEQKVLEPATIRAGVEIVLSDDRHGFYLVAEVDDVIAGGLMVTYEWSDWRNGQIWWIQSVYVPSQFRRQGVYQQLHQRVNQLATEDGQVCSIRLYVEKDNKVAQQTYQKMGMSETDYRIYEIAL